MQFSDLVKQRRSIRRFTTAPIEKHHIEEIVEAATYAPTPCNQQLWKFVAVTDNHIKEQLVSKVFSSTIIKRAPVVLVGCYDAWHFKEAVQAASLATQNILLKATDLGIGALSMNSYGNDRVIKELLKIPKEYIINCFILLGHQEEIYNTTPFVNRRPVQEVLSYNEFTLPHSPSRSYAVKEWTKEKLIDYQKYYCRKTFLGKEMDIMDPLERDLVKSILAKYTNVPMMDFFSYDGGMLSLYPLTSITSINLDEQTQEYVKAAVTLYKPEMEQNMSYQLFDNIDGTTKAATCVFKAERLPQKLRQQTFKKMYEHLDGDSTITIVSRRKSILFSLFYFIIRKKFGDDIRKTGIYAFWGPYEPIKSSVVKEELQNAGYKDVSIKKYFPIPPFFNQALQMFIQYKKSGGSSYLHRKKHTNIVTKILEKLINLQGLRKLPFGSVMVIEAKK